MGYTVQNGHEPELSIVKSRVDVAAGAGTAVAVVQRIASARSRAEFLRRGIVFRSTRGFLCGHR